MITTNTIGQIVRFGLTTAVSALLSFGLPVILHEYFDFSEPNAVVFGFATAYVGNLFLIRTFVFRSTGSWKSETLRYVLSNGAFKIAEYFGFLVLFSVFEIDYRLSLLAVLGASSGIKFFVYRLIFASGSKDI